MTNETALPTNVGSNDQLGLVPERDALAHARARISLLGAQEHMDVLNAALDAVDVLHTAIAAAYGYLWCVNCEPGIPRQYSPERAAHEARKLLRHLLTKEQRGRAINEALTKVHEAVRADAEWPERPPHDATCECMQVGPDYCPRHAP